MPTFGFDSTALDVIDGIDLTGQRALVTGASSGIGVETARALAAAGAEVTLAVRDIAAGERVAADITATHPASRAAVAALDLTDLDSITALTSNWTGPLHLLVNNAGVMALPSNQRVHQRGGPGWEGHFGTNHVGHAALTLGLHRALATEGARVVIVSSAGNLLSPVVFDDINFDYRPYNPWLAYGQSKTANALFAVALTHHWAGEGITANALMPGNITTGLQRHVTPDMFVGLDGMAPPREKSVQQGAATSVYLATSPDLDGISGHYYEDCAPAAIVPNGNGWARGVAPYSLDPTNADRLWELTTTWTGSTSAG